MSLRHHAIGGAVLSELNRNRAEPLHHQLAERLRFDIVSGKLAAGQRLPSEEHLMETYRVSRPTVRQALMTLRLQGLAIVRRGVGTFVSNQVVKKGNNVTHPLEDVGSLGKAATVYPAEANEAASTEELRTLIKRLSLHTGLFPPPVIELLHRCIDETSLSKRQRIFNLIKHSLEHVDETV
jgi:DNA-binding transcriptional regulator YhcF (GntR family)